MPKKAIATLAKMAISIVMVKACAKSGEKVFNAYILSSIRFDLLCWCVGWLGCSLSALLLSIVTNGVYLIALCLHYRRKKERCQVFFKFFFSLGVGARVWARGWWARGCSGGDGGGLDGAG